MKLRYKILIGLMLLTLVGGAAGYWQIATLENREPSMLAFNDKCASCHGEALEGSDTGSALVDVQLKHGDMPAEMMAIITKGVPDTKMAGWEGKLSPLQIKGLALYISERRQKYPRTAASYNLTPQDSRSIKSHYHDFRLERVTNLKSRPYSLAPLPDGEILIAEKTRGLSMVDRQGRQSEILEGAPTVSGKLLSLRGAWLTLGTALDVALHPNYAKNGWVYLSYTDRCQWDCGWPIPATMVRVVRGRVKNGKWLDQETIWSVHEDHYTPVPDGVAAGRLAFDGRGHLYISIGGKNTYDKLHDLNTPFGKIHRVRDEGTIPKDNPFWKPPAKRAEASTAHTVWSYGHRTGQGLDSHPQTGEIWNTEMGPRGGDEINLITGGQNYGWPLYTNGLDYNGEEVSIGKDLGLDFAIEDTVLPVVDFTPAPAISNFTFSAGAQFPGWENDLLVGSLKAAALYRVRIEGGKETERETLISNFGRIRDVAMGYDGFVYIAIEHGENGSLWRIVPE